jgi:hypothetical protein
MISYELSMGRHPRGGGDFLAWIDLARFTVAPERCVDLEESYAFRLRQVGRADIGR